VKHFGIFGLLKHEAHVGVSTPNKKTHIATEDWKVKTSAEKPHGAQIMATWPATKSGCGP